MKTKHNKKRNVAFVYEALVRAGTVAILKEDERIKNKIFEILRRHFKPGTELRKDLDCYRSLYENQGVDRLTAEKILKESKIQKRMINPDQLFVQQTDLIHDINKEASSQIFNSFVPNYKSLATIAQIFSDKVSPRDRIILENHIVQNMQNTSDDGSNLDYMDNIVYKSFVNKFNNKYEDSLLKEQKDLLTYYISSFSDNALELKIFLNEEIGRLKAELKKAKKIVIIEEDEEMKTKVDTIITRLESFSKTNINEEVLACVLKTQQLVKELF
tara:strand:- start:174 stop:989 length:816 start_codon:yes stop_codon:yes gene_type:complete